MSRTPGSSWLPGTWMMGSSLGGATWRFCDFVSAGGFEDDFCGFECFSVGKRCIWSAVESSLESSDFELAVFTGSFEGSVSC